MGCGEREELRTFTMELSTFQQVPFPVVQTMVDVLGLPVAKLQELDMNKDRNPESKRDVCLLQWGMISGMISINGWKDPLL